MVKLLKTEGEKLTQEETEELIITLPIKDTDCVNIEAYAEQLVPIPKYQS